MGRWAKKAKRIYRQKLVVVVVVVVVEALRLLVALLLVSLARQKVEHQQAGPSAALIRVRCPPPSRTEW